MFYSVVANISVKDGENTFNRQIPAFLLNANTQGILTEHGAAEIAKKIINPTNDPNITVYAHVVAWESVQ